MVDSAAATTHTSMTHKRAPSVFLVTCMHTINHPRSLGECASAHTAKHSGDLPETLRTAMSPSAVALAAGH